MSIGSWIKGWRLDKFFHKFFNGVDDRAKKLIPAAIEVVDKFKAALDSNIADVVTDIIPGDLDDHLKENLRAWLPGFILKLDIANATANIEDENERLKAVIALFKFTDDETKDDFYHRFCYRIIELWADGKISTSDAILISEMYYQYKHKQAA